MIKPRQTSQIEEESPQKISGDESPSIDIKVGLNPTSIENYDFPEKMKKLTGKIGIRTVDYSLGLIKPSKIDVKRPTRMELKMEETAEMENLLRQRKEMSSPARRHTT